MGMRIDGSGTIELSGMEFHAYHGCLESERKDGNTFVVDFIGKTAIKKAAKTDSLESASDYSIIYKIVAEQMATPSNLLENVAGRIVDAIMRADGLDFWYAQVRVSKKNPPVGGVCAWSSVTASFGVELLSGEKTLPFRS